MKVKPKHSNTRAIDPVHVLRQAITERCEKNPQYSMRSFAKSTGISHTVLSLVLSGKRKLSKKATLRLADYLDMTPNERSALFRTFKNTNAEEHYETLSLDTFEVISDWYHYAILSCLEIPGAKFEARWMAKQLGIPVVEAKLAIERLLRLQLVRQDESGAWIQATAPLKIDNKLSTAATKKFHKQLLQRAAKSIDDDPVEERDFTSMTFTMDASLVEYAKKKIQTFRRELTADLESKASPNTVFNLTVQLYPVTPTQKMEKKK